MSCQQAIYERTMAGSFMKLLAQNETIDERILLKQKIPGLIGMEKTYYNKEAWYLFNISGKQSMEALCQAQPIRIDFLEKLLVGLCTQVDILEHYLLSVDKLMLEASYIFVTNQNQEIIFTLCPTAEGGMKENFLRLWEYVLSKIDHKDAQTVTLAYEIYEMAQEEDYLLEDLRDHLRLRIKVDKPPVKQEETVVASLPKPQPMEEEEFEEPQVEGHFQQTFGVIKRKLTELRAQIFTYKEKAMPEEKLEVSYPTDYEAAKPKAVIHPTICLSDYRAHPDGLLLYEGYENLSDYRIEEELTYIGQGEEARLQIPKETVSHFHACIRKKQEDYYLEDMNSTNGTFVNDQLLSYKEERKLKSNDIIRFADVKYRFV